MALVGLTFRSRYGKLVPDDVDGGVILRGEVEWIAEGGEPEIAVLSDAVAGLGTRTAGAAILKLGNVVGRFDLGALGFICVRCGKLDEQVFDGMLDDLTRTLAALPFSATQAAGIPHDRSIADRDEVLLHAFIYLRHVLLDLKGEQSLVHALDAVVRDPHRRFGSERANVGLHVASRIDTRTITRIVEGRGVRVRAPEYLAQGALAIALGGHIPERVDIPQVTSTYDTAENRFALEFLKQSRAIIERVERLALRKAKPSAYWLKTLANCAAMKRVLAPFERHDMWTEVRNMDHVPFGSSVLQRRRGYKDVLRHYLTMRAAARIPLDENTITKHLLGLKDVATLYEVWCYFVVVDTVGTLLRRQPDVVDTFDVKVDRVVPERGFLARWVGGPTVYYNASFTSKKKAPWRSASLMLRPDIVIELVRDGGTELHVFDAKLKVDGVVLAKADEDDESEPSKDRYEDADDEFVDPLKFENDDIAKMHAYRDALPNVRSARALYPGNVERTFRALEPHADGLDVVGAVPLVPGDEHPDLKKALAAILRCAEILDGVTQEPSTADPTAVTA